MATHNTPLAAFDSQAADIRSKDTLDAIIQIAEEQRGYIAEMHTALTAGDDQKLKLFASKLCGMEAPAITSI
jgi:hypothetical protein